MSVDNIKKLRELTSLGVGDCRQALMESEGNFDKALDILKKKGAQVSEKRGARKVSQGIIESYVHFGGNLGALVEINCETDFVARTEVFKKFAKDLAMQVAAAAPAYVKREDIPQDVLSQIKDLEVYVKESCLLEQAFVKDNSMTIGAYLTSVISQTGENVIIRRFSRFSLGA